MKKNSQKKKENKVTKINQFNILFVDIQIILTIMTVVLFVLVLLNKTSLKMLELSLGLTLLSMAFNNYKIYKRSKLTFLYLIAGIAIIICVVAELIMGV